MKSSVMVVLPLYFAVCVLYGEQSSKDSFSRNRPDYRANLKLAAFNVQTFGIKKMATAGVPEILVRIILRYDVILIQEIRDSSGKAIVDLLSMINRNSNRGQYNITISPRLGRSSSKEQYAFFYRKDALSVKATYVYDDGDERINNDTFEREPYIVHFKSQFTSITDFVLVAIHTSPSKAPQEIDELTSVYDDVTKRLNVQDVVILGDLNAACRYMSDSDWRQVSLANDKRFHWLISDCVDTTVGGGLCAYDRFVVAGEAMLKAVILSSARRFEYDREYSINRSMAFMVSDHFPIQMQLFSRVLASAKSLTQTSVEYTFKQRQPISLSKETILTFGRKKLLQREGFSMVVTYSAKHAIAGVTFAKDFKNWNEALNGITVVQTKSVHNRLITDDQAEMAVFQITGAWAEEIKVQVDKTGVVKLVCEMKPSPWCWITLSLD